MSYSIIENSRQEPKFIPVTDMEHQNGRSRLELAQQMQAVNHNINS